MTGQYTGSAGKTAHFNIQKHSIPASHIREYPRATADGQEDALHLAIKQYTPLHSSSKSQNSVTIIGAHANGFPKVIPSTFTCALEFELIFDQELYEPLWDDLYERLQLKGVHISSIWIADVAHQGDSGVLNEDLLGNDPSWYDHPRDLFLMINHFREHMKRPLIGIGHSMGGNNLVNLSLLHPRLLTSLILIDPVMLRFPSAQANFGPARASTVRRDRWPSRAEAETSIKKSKFYQAWDPRVLAKWMEHGLRDLPTALYPEVSTSTILPPVSADPSTASIPAEKNTEREVTLQTTKHQEVSTFLRPNFSPTPNMVTHPDIDPDSPPTSPFYRPEPIATFKRLPHLRPSVLYVFGDQSDLSAPLMKADKMAQTGIGVGGSGGVVKGRVSEHTFKGVGHLIPMEVVGETADVSAEWLVPELERWRTAEEVETREWSAVPRSEKSQLSEEYKTVMTSDWSSYLKQGSKL